MRFSSLAALATFSTGHAQNQNGTIWSSTVFINQVYSSTSVVRYGATAVTPVPTTTADIVIVTSYISELTASKNINRTSWATVVVTLPLETKMSVVYTTLETPPTKTLNATTTEITWTSPVVATITFSRTICTNGATPPMSTLTKFSGEYEPIPGQATTTRTSWPTAVTSYFYFTEFYRVFAYVGSTITVTSTVTGTAWLSTTTSTTTVAVYLYTRTQYRATVTMTSSDYQLAYTTSAVGVACDGEIPATVTFAARCAPTNLISERDNRGVAVRLLPRDWSFPIGFPDTLIGVPGMDASTCCHLCAGNEGCAASEWTTEGRGACRLYYYNTPRKNETCGVVPLEYYGDLYALPGQGSYLQLGCGKLNYLGVMNPFCPTCPL